MVAHAPTARAIKSTDRVIAAVERLQSAGVKVRLDIIENTPWQECLRRKAQADVLVDQVILGYGNNAIEAWGMKMPVIAGVADPKVRRTMLDRWGSLPFYEASEETLEEAIRQMVRSRSLREEWAIRGHEHVMRWHDAIKVVTFLRDVYTESITRRA